MNFQTSEEIRRINIALDKLKRRASSQLLQSIENHGYGTPTDAPSGGEPTFVDSVLMQSKFGKKFIKGWIKKRAESIWNWLR